MSHVLAVASAAGHGFSKSVQPEVRLVAALGVEGDAHAGVTVKHRSRVAIDPSQPNLRQVHLLDAALLARVGDRGFGLPHGGLGENVLTEGLDLLALPTGARLRLGEAAIVEVTGLRNPCAQIEAYLPGLLAEVLEKRADGTVVRKAGVMAIVIESGTVRPGDAVSVILPPPPWRALERV